MHPKVEEIWHPPSDQLAGLDYCIDSNPPWAEAIILGFQHYIVMLGTTVIIPTLLVPRMGGDDTLFGTRLPTVIGGSYAFLIPTFTIINSSSLQKIDNDQERFLHTMRNVQGALISSSSLQIILGYSGLWGILSRFLSPLGAAPVIALVGLGLFQLGFPEVGKCVEVGILELILLAIFSLYLRHFKLRKLPLFERYPVLLSVVIIWAFAYLLTVGGAYKHVYQKTKLHCRTDKADLIRTAPWIRIPYPLEWGAPSFDAGHTFAMMASVFVSLVESTGGYIAVSRLASATPPPASILSRGIGWQGVGILLNGLFGTLTGSTVLIENTGLLGITRVGSRRVIQISSCFMIFFSILGKFGALFASIPFPMFGAMYCILFGIVTATGLSFLQFTNMNSLRSTFIVGLSIFLGLSIPQYFDEYTATAGYGPVRSSARWFNDILDTLFSSPATVALMVAVLLDNTYRVKDSKVERGMPWWARFRSFKGDSRNDEFYTLPFNLHRFFPPT
ncbi:hypothetical protein KP509_09G071100 [Ceratopteris richardii]|uniref:Uncharacterized protein n=1 Tax=Ceratopteris richardii TaxID=49495 RepID=A0A8T2U2E9_CERRI|nr:hypothetical protein KP509_09G071100 [Ceratopteris richardii]